MDDGVGRSGEIDPHVSGRHGAPVPVKIHAHGEGVGAADAAIDGIQGWEIDRGHVRPLPLAKGANRPATRPHTVMHTDRLGKLGVDDRTAGPGPLDRGGAAGKLLAAGAARDTAAEDYGVGVLGGGGHGGSSGTLKGSEDDAKI